MAGAFRPGIAQLVPSLERIEEPGVLRGMWYLTVLTMLAFSPLMAAELEEWRRSEDWEVALGQAGEMARARRFAEAGELFQHLAEAAERYQFPLLMKAKCVNNYGAMLMANGQFAEAEKRYREAVRYWAGATGEESDETATTLNNLGELYRRMGRYAEAEEVLRRSLGIRERLGKNNELRVAGALNNLGTVQREAGRLREAAASFERALEMKRRLGDLGLGKTLNNLGSAHQDLGDAARAEALYLEAEAALEGEAGAELASVWNNLGTLHRKTGRMESAEAYLRRANALWEKTLGGEHPSLAAGWNNLAELLVTVGRAGEAEPLYRRAIAVAEKTHGAGLADMVDNLGVLFLRQEKGVGAEALFRRAVALRTAAVGRTGEATLGAMHHLSQALGLQKRYTEAERLLLEELAIVEENRMQRSAPHGLVLAELALVQLAQRRYAEGERYLEAVSAFATELPAVQQEGVAELFKAYANLLRGAKRNRDAARIEGRANSLLAPSR